MVKTKRPALKLRIEMIPLSSWGQSAYRFVSKSEWAKIREKTHQRNGYKCEICGSNAKLNCHEEWHFKDSIVVQHLAGMRTLCDMCHRVTHFARAKQISAKRDRDIEVLIAHFMKVNKCDRDTFLQHEKESNALFERRSKIEWLISFGEYSLAVAERCLERGQNLETAIVSPTVGSKRY
jgi:hypothetical protein